MKWRHRNDMLNYIKLCMKQDGKPWFHWRYRVSKELSDLEVKNIALKYLMDPEGEYSHFTMGDLDGRYDRWKNENSK